MRRSSMSAARTGPNTPPGSAHSAKGTRRVLSGARVRRPHSRSTGALSAAYISSGWQMLARRGDARRAVASAYSRTPIPCSASTCRDATPWRVSSAPKCSVRVTAGEGPRPFLGPQRTQLCRFKQTPPLGDDGVRGRGRGGEAGARVLAGKGCRGAVKEYAYEQVCDSRARSAAWTGSPIRRATSTLPER